MKSILLFSFLSLLANTFWCGRNEEDPIAVGSVYDGYWNITDLHTKRFTRKNQLIWETKQVFTTGERAFEFGQEDYREYENGNLSRLGNYAFYNQKVILMADGDTIYTEIFGHSDHSLTIQNIERDSIGYEIKLINAQK